VIDLDQVLINDLGWKRCSHCQIVKRPADFPPDSDMCSKCAEILTISREERILMEDLGWKQCSRCGEVKPARDFPRRGGGRRLRKCKECYNADMRRWRAHRDELAHFPAAAPRRVYDSGTLFAEVLDACLKADRQGRQYVGWRWYKDGYQICLVGPYWKGGPSVPRMGRPVAAWADDVFQEIKHWLLDRNWVPKGEHHE